MKYIDDYIRKKVISDGMKQVVFIGGGMDTRAFRDDMCLQDV
jgi:O-methyltransferase involved in polyketide biosynthesis